MREIEVKLARATSEDIRVVREFFQMLEEIVEYGTYTPINEDQETIEEESIDVDTDEKLGELIRDEWNRVSLSWSRVVWGCDVVIANCCDLNSDVLELKPELAELQSENEKLKKTIEIMDRKQRHGCYDARCSECDE